MKELQKYCSAAVLPEWNDDAMNVLAKMKKFIRRFFAFLIERQDEDFSQYFNGNTNNILRLQEWSLVWSSILLMSYDRHFCLSLLAKKR
jgi:hypothetical protein